jgi:chromosome segregation ATPase
MTPVGPYRSSSPDYDDRDVLSLRDEIKRLRALLAEVNRQDRAAEAELVRLREDRENLAVAYTRMANRLRERDDEIARVELLREALDWIIAEPEDPLRVQLWARAALDGKPFVRRPKREQ